MSTASDTPAVNEIRERLAFRTHHLGRYECEEVWKLCDRLMSRIACESWGHRMGWDIPPYGTPDWQELFEAWLESKDEE